MKKLFLLLFVLCFLPAVSLPARADGDAQVFVLDGQKYPVSLLYAEEGGEEDSEPQTAGKTAYLDLDDEDAQSLISLSGRRFSWSSNGKTLMVFGKELQITAEGEGDIRFSDGGEKNVGGSLKMINGRHAMTADLFIYLLGFMAEAASPGEDLKLLHLICAPKVVNNSLGTRLIFDTDSKPNYTVEDTAPHRIVLRFKNSAWGEALKLHLNCVDLEAGLAKDNSSDLLLTFITDDCWSPKIQRGVDTRQVVIAKVLTFDRARNGREDVNLRSLRIDKTEPENGSGSEEGGSAQGGAEVISIGADGPFKYVWSYCKNCRKVRADVIGVHGLAAAGGGTGDYFSDFSAGEYYCGGLTVGSVEFTLQEGCSFSADADADEYLLRIKIVRDGSELSEDLSGSGFVGRFEAAPLTVVLDPGHGGGDPGCRSRHFGVCEKEVTLDVALRLRDLLEEMGINVIMTRETDRDVSWRGSPDKVELQSRCDVANNAEADYFISLHCNANVYTSVHGSSVYWYKPEDRELSAYFANALGNLGFYWIGNIRDGFYVLRHTDMPAILIEMAFLTNYRDGAKLVKPECRQTIAEDLAEVFRAILEDRSAP